jgi:hypothetical protein
MDKNEVRKELMKSKSLASFHHYTAGNMYYTVSILGVIYQFPIPTLDRITYGDEETAYRDTYYLSEDLGTTSFFRDIKASELNRWIGKAIDNEEFIKISE